MSPIGDLTSKAPRLPASVDLNIEAIEGLLDHVQSISERGFVAIWNYHYNLHPKDSIARIRRVEYLHREIKGRANKRMVVGREPGEVVSERHANTPQLFAF